MAKIALNKSPVETSGNLAPAGSACPDFKLVRVDLSEVSLQDFTGKKKVLNIFPSIDTGTCAASVRRFNKEATDLNGVVVLNISADLPFAQKRFCATEGITNAEALSSFRSSFASDFGLQITSGPLKGLCSRCVIVLDEKNKILYTEQVQDIVDEPNYEAALKALK